MFAINRFNWVEIRLDDWFVRVDKTTDIVNDVIDGLTAFLQNTRRRSPAAIVFDAGCWETTIVFDWYVTHVIEDNGPGETYVHRDFDRKILDVVQEIIDDFRSDIPAWAALHPSEPDLKYHNDPELTLTAKLNILQNLVDNWRAKQKKGDY